ncbi:ATP-binding protein [Kitasatospora sp. NBC_00374]|uniref:AAA family ATPase n=1 Tax=Kitasatospora sp. NBC_00374 TaxID=2975964 RepID=UPI0030E0D493
MSWNTYYVGDGIPRDVVLADPPPWRTFPRRPLDQQYRPPEGLAEAVNAALYLRRPLLITGSAGSGKSTVIEQVAAELKLGPVLRWHLTSRSTLADALCRYDALGRIHAQRLHRTDESEPAGEDDIAPFLQLGPLGTALVPSDRPRALLIDEVDKSDLDLPSDLLDVLERGEFEVPELVRYSRSRVMVREWGSDRYRPIERGRVQCTEFPFIVMTSNGERDFPPPFLRRCIRYRMPRPTDAMLRQVVIAHLGCAVLDGSPVADLIESFARRVQCGENLAVDQLLNAARLLTDPQSPSGDLRERLVDLLTRELTSD